VANNRLLFGGDTTPFITAEKEAPLYKSSSPFAAMPQAVRDTHVDILDLSKPEDFSYYEKIWRAVGFGSVTVVVDDKQWVESAKSWKVFIRWYINGKMDPKELRKQVASHMRNLHAASGVRNGLQGVAEEEIIPEGQE
jgi:hypothetical protein